MPQASYLGRRRSGDLLKCLPVPWKITKNVQGRLWQISKLLGNPSEPGVSLGNACHLRYPICDFFPLLHTPMADCLDLHVAHGLMALHRTSVRCSQRAAGVYGPGCGKREGGSWEHEFQTHCTKSGGSVQQFSDLSSPLYLAG